MSGTAKETTPSEISEVALAFAASIGAEAPRFVDVVEDRCGRFGYCARGVDRKVRQDGGERRCGWIIWEMAGMYLTAEFHAVWWDGGRMVDITPKPDREARILFAPDPRYGPAFDFNRRPDNKLSRAYRPPEPDEIAQARILAFTPVQHDYESRRASKAGLSLLDWVSSRVPQDAKAGLIDEYIAVIEKLHSLSVVTGQGTVLPRTPLAMRMIRRQVSLKAALRI